MRRREVLQIIACAIAIAPDTIAVQTAAKTYRIGTLTVNGRMSGGPTTDIRCYL